MGPRRDRTRPRTLRGGRRAACNRRAAAVEFTGHAHGRGKPRRSVMAKGQMRSNKEKKKPKQDKNLKKGGAAPSPFASGKTPAGQNPGKK